MLRKDFYQQVRLLRINAAKTIEGIYSGNYRSVFKGPGLEYRETREYIPADDARFIDWNVSSRMGSPYTKVFQEEREINLFLVLDASESLDSGSGPMSKRDILHILAAHLSFAAVSNQDKVGALYFSDRIEKWVGSAKGAPHASRLIQDGLSLEPQGRGSDLALALRTCHEALHRRGIIVVISDFRSDGYWKEMAVLAKRHDVICIMITDPLDSHFPVSGRIRLEDPETGELMTAYGRSSGFRERYHDDWNLHVLTWKRECLRRGASVLELSTRDDPASHLVKFFNRRKGRS